MNSINEIAQDTVLTDFNRIVREKLKNRILLIKLFGSRARGDNLEYSDYDFLVVVDKKEDEIKGLLTDIAVEILNKYDRLVGYILWDQEEWLRKKNFPIGLNILKEGVEL